MSDILNPQLQPEQAAFQLLIELIRAERVPMVSCGSGESILKIYDLALEHFSNPNNKPDHSPDV